MDRHPHATLVGHIECRLLLKMVDDEYDSDIDMDSNNEEDDIERASEEN